MKRIVVIGSGLGGLSCGALLSRNGFQVTVLEQGLHVGGCLQCFVRRGNRFETGMHFIGSAGKGQILDKLFRYLGIRDDLRLQALDADGYDVVSLGGEQFRFANGRDPFIQQMSSYFPSQTDQLACYYDLVAQVARSSSMHSLCFDRGNAVLSTEYMLRSINEVIDSVITDPLLARVLVGNLPLYAAERDKTPFATHAFVMDFYNQGAYRFVGGSDQLAHALRRQIEAHGGEVLVNSKATRILCDSVQATAVEVNGERLLPADYVIAGIHPCRMLELLDTPILRPSYRQRIQAIPNTISTFSLFLQFRPEAMPYMNHNLYAYHQPSPWGCEHYDESTWPKGYLYMHFCNEPNPRYAHSGVVLSYMQMDDVRQWQDTCVGHRGQAYEDFKHLKAERLLDALEKDMPGLRQAVAHYYTATPLTYRDYTGTEEGSLYGVAKDIHLGTAGRVSHRTKVPNLLLTGQNINSHGVLGVLVGTIVTCSDILGTQTVFNQIMEANQ
ncbi:MAG: NAD(P)/FAD-dependent oxidoreductase [Bacteroidaceae bacterium]|nr:NAD(P)/FAD-dependent oxidoreductase [Bacteroidaceae bacterium]